MHRLISAGRDAEDALAREAGAFCVSWPIFPPWWEITAVGVAAYPARAATALDTAAARAT